MATLHAEVNKNHKRKDGCFPVTIRVTHHRQHVRMKTNLVAYPDDFTRDGKLKGNMKFKAEDLVRRMYEALGTISYFDLEKGDASFVAEQIKAKMEPENWSLDFFEFADEYLKKAPITESTKHTYRVALSALERYNGAESLDINDITHVFLEDFVYFLNTEPKYHYDKKLKLTVATKQKKRTGTAAKAYLVKLGTIFKAAKRRYNDEDIGLIRIPRSPFEKVKVVADPAEGQEPLDLATVRKMIASEPQKISERKALDVFLLSLGLMGPNMADLYYADQTVKEMWDYRRKKTYRRRSDHARMKVLIPDCLAPYITRLTVGAAPDRWLNISAQHKQKDYAIKSINDGLKSWCKNNGVPEFTFYAARKTWATIARSKECSVDKALIADCLDHVGSLRLVDLYASKDWRVIWEANEKVCKYIWGDA